MKEIHALLPRLFSEIGHIFPYHKAVQKAVTFAGWTYTAYCPKTTNLSSHPSNWNPVLADDISDCSKGVWLKLKYFILNLLPIYKIFKTLKKKNQAVVFIEHFEIQHLASIAFSIFFLKPQFHFWILHRYEFENRKVKILLHRFFLWYMRRKLGKEKVKCLTDSELLAESIKNDLKCPLLIAPIPHIEESSGYTKQEDRYLFWWPGGLIREDKGLSKILKLLTHLENREDIRLVAAESARNIFGSHSKIHFIPTFLDREAYLNQMQIADIILLPYSGEDYGKRTSGIFVESVFLGSIPVTTKNTWMAYELLKFGLPELIFEWDESNLIDLLCGLIKNPEIKKKLKKMETFYREFHGLRGFSNFIQEIGPT